MEVIITSSPEEASAIAARLMARQIRKNPESVLGLATGSTPCRLYELLIAMHREKGLDFSRVTTFNLDEYVGILPEHSASYHRFMEERFFAHVNVERARCHLPNGLAADVPGHCLAYERAIVDAGGIDLQVLGLGSDGHIGFNEPGSSLSSRTRIKTLTAQTRRDNARFFSSESDVPHHVITMGLQTILESRVCLLLAFGRAKAWAAAQCVEGPVTASVPASVLQFHPEIKLLVDAEAASELQNAEYYRWVYANKPAWQRDL